MKNICRTFLGIMVCAAALLGVCSYMPENVRTFKGKTQTECAGLKESGEGFLMTVKDEGTVKEISMKDFHTLGYKDMSITAALKTDGSGNVISVDNIVFKGAPAKLKTVTGKVTDKDIDITFKGKAVGVFTFVVKYQASAL